MEKLILNLEEEEGSPLEEGVIYFIPTVYLFKSPEGYVKIHHSGLPQLREASEDEEIFSGYSSMLILTEDGMSKPSTYYDIPVVRIGKDVILLKNRCSTKHLGDFNEVNNYTFQSLGGNSVPVEAFSLDYLLTKDLSKESSIALINVCVRLEEYELAIAVRDNYLVDEEEEEADSEVSKPQLCPGEPLKAYLDRNLQVGISPEELSKTVFYVGTSVDNIMGKVPDKNYIQGFLSYADTILGTIFVIVEMPYTDENIEDRVAKASNDASKVHIIDNLSVKNEDWQEKVYILKEDTIS